MTFSESADAAGGMVSSVVSVRSGRVRGSFDGNVHRFLGVPYAEPPNGDRRFALPVPKAPWHGTLDATSYGPTPQRKPFADVTTIPEPSIPGDDTLSVNVFTPDPAADELLPVMVWIHGGGYISGSAASPWYDGRSFARDGVVTVSVSYRLGFDGFGWLPDRPSNRGLADVLLALQWVHANISAFGGDPRRVTVAGQSAGGGLVMTLLAIPEAWPLFQRAIAISAVALEMTVARAQQVTSDTAAALEIAPSYEGFASLGERRIVDAQGPPATEGAAPVPHDLLRSFANFGEDLRFGPIVGLPPYEIGLTKALATGNVAQVPVLFGATRDEFTFIAKTASTAFEHMHREEVAAAMGLQDRAATDYLAAHPRCDSAEIAGALMSDLVIRSSIPVWAQALAQPTWAYDFAWEGAPSGMAEHCFDLPFAFDLLDASGVERVLGAHPPQDLADALHTAFVRFVRGDSPGWATTGNSGTQALVLTAEASVDPHAYATALLAGRSHSTPLHDA